MAITKIQSESLNLADTYAFTGTVTGAGGVNTPAFSATITSTQNITNNSETKIAFATEQYDTDSAYDHSTNYRFTVPSGEGGKYFFSAYALAVAEGTLLSNAYIGLKVNGSMKQKPFWFSGTASGNIFNAVKYIPLQIHATYNLSASDYVEAFVYLAKSSGSGTHELFSGESSSHFAGHKIIE